jgi:hypothetical protein
MTVGGKLQILLDVLEFEVFFTTQSPDRNPRMRLIKKEVPVLISSVHQQMMPAASCRHAKSGGTKTSRQWPKEFILLAIPLVL